jgi:hypothetical protein
MDPKQYPGDASRQAGEQTVFRLSILGAILLCALIAGLLGDSLIGVYRIEVGAPVPRGWRWLLGTVEQTFASQTVALLFGMLLLGFALGGFLFLIMAGIRWLRDQWR